MMADLACSVDPADPAALVVLADPANPAEFLVNPAAFPDSAALGADQAEVVAADAVAVGALEGVAADSAADPVADAAVLVDHAGNVPAVPPASSVIGAIAVRMESTARRSSRLKTRRRMPGHFPSTELPLQNLPSARNALAPPPADR